MNITWQCAKCGKTTIQTEAIEVLWISYGSGQLKDWSCHGRGYHDWNELTNDLCIPDEDY